MSGKPQLKGRAARLARLFPTAPGQAARTPFVLLVVLLLGGGLIGLLVLNSALSEGSFELADLQRETKNLTDEEQALQRDIDAYSAPDALQRRARELGMVPGGDPAFLNPDGTIRGMPSPAPAAAAQGTARVPLVLAPEAMRDAPAVVPTPATSAAPPATSSAPPAGAPATTLSAAPTAPHPAPSAPTTPPTTPGR
ncbi:septum formation initiator family protein [Streptomyces sp. JB150]|uniref:FtsB family cell division protein n=1 Tax=Streptomyces sp. JB150 TaxID=2714844 RepID=UPI00140CB1EC|nr:septum formation initiator family protein [Streptomyces sp. JB150]QIJ62931.1 septum formation initiator family protein [Streptomyces sp. JB150]